MSGAPSCAAVDVEADAVGDAAGARAAVAEVQRQRVGRVARGEPHRDLDRAIALLQLDDVAADRAVESRGRRRARSARRCPRSAWSATSAAPAARRCWQSGRRRRSDRAGTRLRARLSCCGAAVPARRVLACSVTVFGANAVSGTTPSCSHLRQSRSNGDARTGSRTSGAARHRQRRCRSRRCAGAAMRGGAALANPVAAQYARTSRSRTRRLR